MAINLRILGVDPSLNNFAMATVYAQIEGSAQKLRVRNVELVRSDNSQDDFSRAQTIAKAFYTKVRYADIIIAELPRGAQSARAAWTLGIVLGILACCKKQVVTVTPYQTKLVTGNKHAKKDAMLLWAIKEFPETPWYTDANGNPYKYNHHVADALAAINAGLAYKRKEILNGTIVSSKKSKSHN